MTVPAPGQPGWFPNTPGFPYEEPPHVEIVPDPILLVLEELRAIRKLLEKRDV